jgi:hypothetical protein
MVNWQLVSYIRQYRAQFAIPQLKQTLLSQGYREAEVNEAINYAIGPQVQAQAVQRPSYISVSAIISRALIPSAANGAIKVLFLLLAAIIGPGATLWGYVFKFMSGLILGLIIAIIVVEYGKKIPLGKDVDDKAFYYFVIIDVVLLVIFGFDMLLASAFAFVFSIFGAAAADYAYAKLLSKRM